MREHVKILAVLNIVLGSLGVIGALIILLVSGSLAGLIARSADPGDAVAAVPILTGIGFAIAAFLFLVSLPSIVGGWGLLQFRPWARVLMIVISALELIHVPIGTAIGIYGLWVLLSEQGQRLFETGGWSPAAGPGARPVYPDSGRYSER